VSLIVAILVGIRRTGNPSSMPAAVCIGCCSYAVESVVLIRLQYFSDSPFSVLSPSTTLFVYIPWSMMWSPSVLLDAGARTFM
jgi:hypothetical protein